MNNNYPLSPSKFLTEEELKNLLKRKKERFTSDIKKISKKSYKKPIPILRYYNSKLIIPVYKKYIIPGNFYVFSYSEYKHVPTPLIFYIGSNLAYNTLEGISIQYLTTKERQELLDILKLTPLHSEQMYKNAIPIKDLHNEIKHIYPNTYSSLTMYYYLKNKLKNEIYFYRRYKINKITSRIYVVPIENIEAVIQIFTPIKPRNPKFEDKFKKNFNFLIRTLGKIK